jgi:hypothetical protein
MQQSFSGESIKLVVAQACLMELRYPMESVDVALRYASHFFLRVSQSQNRHMRWYCRARSRHISFLLRSPYTCLAVSLSAY